MFFVGCHLSASGGFMAMGRTALEIGANTFQFFTRNPRGGKAKELSAEDVTAFCAFAAEHGFGPLVAHAPYTLNACGADQKVRDFARMVMEDDLRRMEAIPSNYYNFHPGSHVGQGVDEGIRIIAGLLNALVTPQQTTTVLLETMAGKGSEVGGRFEELRRIIDALKRRSESASTPAMSATPATTSLATSMASSTNSTASSVLTASRPST